eukprot:CAMPEP_0183702354 /NCGR_PEP_ID=MMETSP0737-20130205/481_1 /TAXON_ID=385413 /ORGANISM="Thalassiosira miniscula, Strain CCMP1093" /LENGTH=386 /DNA_ID=CAMNT_0025928951 /DNA_START=234 /DNA_END=1394 /DNA_ORIENTATION=-
MIADKAKKSMPRHPRATKKKANVAATSPVAMGKALVLLATSCAALSSGGGSSRAASRARPTLGGRLHHPETRGNGEFHSSIVALHYRDGDEDQSAEMRRASRRAVGGVAGQVSKSSGSGSRNNQQQVSPSMTMPSINPFTLLPTIRHHAPPSKEEQEQLVMDEYIEYYERRYSRLHPRSNSPQPSSRPWVVLDLRFPRKIFFSTISLHRSQPLSAAPTMAAEDRPKEVPAQPQVSQEEDPLNVLGLSNLASARLRERLHVPRDLREEHAMIRSSTESAVNFLTHCRAAAAAAAASKTSSAIVSAAKTAAKTGTSSARVSSLTLSSQLRPLLIALRRLAAASTRTARILEAILNRGGFRRSARALGVASLALLVVVRPLFRGALKQG